MKKGTGREEIQHEHLFGGRWKKNYIEMNNRRFHHQRRRLELLCQLLTPLSPPDEAEPSSLGGSRQMASYSWKALPMRKAKEPQKVERSLLLSADRQCESKRERRDVVGGTDW